MKLCILAIFCVSSALSLPLNKGRIIGGADAGDGQFRFAASIVYKTPEGSFFCAGTLHRKLWIVTAGQCAYNAYEFSIRLGSNTRQGDDGQIFTATEFFLPSDFSASPLTNDIALIKLPNEVTLDDFVRPIQFMDFTGLPEDYETVAIGWGQTSDDNDNFSDTLQWVYVTSITNEQCKATYGDQITDEKVCVVGANNAGTCLGDSGAALIHYPTQDMTVLVGVSSFLSQNGCENSDPSGFTRVYPFRDWIANQTNPNN